jgi:lipopolysaccharide transport system ATP-binding protein
MNETVITVENLSKKYIIGHQRKERYTALRDVIVETAVKWGRRIAMRPMPDPTHEEIWALKDVSFEVKQGERVGIIGRNGAGKSTLLKLLSRITYPTSGRIKLRGRVASLLEVATGFHPELTGRENIYLNGAILGMSRAEINRKFDEIVAFAEVEKFLDTPVKRFSSGMYVRLAFAVAAHLEPEILLVDEVLAVGDAQFQKKCLGKMEEVSNKDGRTVLFVSHNMEAIQNLCSKSILLQNGKMLSKGFTPDVVHQYINQDGSNQLLVEWTDINNAPGNEKIKILKAEVMTDDRNNKYVLSNKPFALEFHFLNMMPGENNLDITYHLYNEMGVLVYVGSTGFNTEKYFESGIIKGTCYVPSNLLNEGIYTIKRLLIVKDNGTIIYEHNNILVFEVINPATDRLGWYGEKEGVIKPNLDWEYIHISNFKEQNMEKHICKSQ